MLKLLSFSKPGSKCTWIILPSIACKLNKTDDKLLQEVHFKTLQVLINDQLHTFPSTYKLGLNLVLLLEVQ